MSLRRFLNVERRLRTITTPSAPDPVKQPAQAEAVLTALATRFPPGSTICREQVAEAAAVSMSVAGAVRIWARSVDRWPYVDSKGGFGHRRKGGGS